MSHLDPEELALLAMGEPVDDAAQADHLAECDACRLELAQLRHAVEVGRATIDVGELETPSPVVWDRIAEELEFAPRESEGTPADPAPETRAQRRRAAESAEADAERAAEASASRPPRRWTRAVFALAAALVLVLVVGAGALFLVQRNAQVPVAEAVLEPFPEHAGATGSAVVERRSDGADVLKVTLDAPGEASGYREVWLITADATALISLGVLEGTEGTFPVPSGVDLREFVLVDISDEPVDGDPTHSGDSVVRGELSFV